MKQLKSRNSTPIQPKASRNGVVKIDKNLICKTYSVQELQPFITMKKTKLGVHSCF